MRGVFFFLLVFCVLISQAQIPAGYYDSAASLSGDVLRAELRDISSATHVKLPYTSAAFDVWDAYAVTDVFPAPNNTIVWDMYSDIPSGSPAYQYTIYTDQCLGGSAAEGTCYSREHVMPNSWWGGLDNASNPQYTDVHCLFPADQYVNQEKSSYPLGETDSPYYISSNGSAVGACSFSGYSGTVFEPIDEYKGDFARVYFYIATRYMGNISNWVTSYPSTDGPYVINSSTSNLQPWVVNMLVSWHLSDPVSAKEIARNDSIYYATPQHNRNPYVDHPEYVCLVWTSSYCTSAPIIINVAHTPSSPAATNDVSVGADITDDGTVVSAILVWCIDGVSFGDTIIMNLSSGDHYDISSLIPAQTGGTTVTYKIIAEDDLGNTATSSEYSYTIPTGAASACGTDLIISEYIEGSSFNKYIEIFNGTGVDVDLSNYRLRLFANGASSPTNDEVLSGTLQADSVVVYQHPSAIAYTGTAINNNAVNFNGDDVIALYNVSAGAYSDIIGHIGQDPGTAWTGGSNTTVNATLIRNADVYSGVSISVAGFPSLGTEWTMSSIDDVSDLGKHTTTCLPLPVELLYFRAECLDENSISVQWATASETNSAFFRIEKSVDGREWTPIADVPSAGNSNTTQHYNLDVRADQVSYLRLWEYDVNGKEQLLSFCNVDCQYENTLNFQVFPNPFRNDISIALPEDAPEFLICIKNIYGAQVYCAIKTGGSKNDIIQLNLPDFNTGMYILEFTVSGSIYRKQLVRE
jgi:endonuclease I